MAPMELLEVLLADDVERHGLALPAKPGGVGVKKLRAGLVQLAVGGPDVLREAHFHGEVIPGAMGLTTSVVVFGA